MPIFAGDRASTRTRRDSLGDLMEPVSVGKALVGVDKLYLLNAVTPDELTQGLIAFDLAKKAKLAQSKLAIESALRRFNLPFTIIRPNYFFQNDASLKNVLEIGIYPIPLGPTGISAVDVRDIAEATAIALTEPGHEGKTINLNGPEILSGTKVASIWSGVLGTTIRYAGHDMDAFETQMRQKAPAWSAFDMRMMFQGYLERGFVAEPGDIETLGELIGHAPRRYQNFARETALAWRSVVDGVAPQRPVHV